MDGAFWYTNRQWHKDFGNVRCCESTWRKNSKEGLLALSMTWLIVVVTMDLEGRVQILWYVFCTWRCSSCVSLSDYNEYYFIKKELWLEYNGDQKYKTQILSYLAQDLSAKYWSPLYLRLGWYVITPPQNWNCFYCCVNTLVCICILHW